MISSMNGWRDHVLFSLLLLMLGSLYLSRAVLSISMIVFVAVSFMHANPGRQLQKFFREPILWCTAILFFLPFVSGIWSHDKEQWAAIVQLKVPLFFLPLAFAAPFSFSERMWNILMSVFVLLVITGTLWSMYYYAIDTKLVNESYLKAKSLLTPLENDHVRFSWMVSAAVLTTAWFAFRINYKPVKWIAAILVIWFVIYLHILAARTGLICFYIELAITLVWLVTRNRWKMLAALLIIPLITVIAYFLLPTFKNRLSYFKYDMDYFRTASYLPGANDAVRVISLKAGWEIMNEYPLQGTGSGDLEPAVKEWYELNYPQMLETDKIYPSSEWLMYGSSLGWPGFILFTLSMLVIIFRKINSRLTWLALTVPLVFSLVFDIGLSVQFGIFLFAFFILTWWKCLSAENA
jgi:O-antigen ligase